MGVLHTQMSVDHVHVSYMRRPEKGTRYPENGVADTVKHHVGARNQPQRWRSQLLSHLSRSKASILLRSDAHSLQVHINWVECHGCPGAELQQPAMRPRPGKLDWNSGRSLFPCSFSFTNLSLCPLFKQIYFVITSLLIERQWSHADSATKHTVTSSSGVNE